MTRHGWKRRKRAPERRPPSPGAGALVLVLALSVLSAPAAGQNVSVRDYSVPVSRADNLRIDALSFTLQTVGDSVVSQQGSFSVVYKKFYESLPFAYSVDLLGVASFRRDPSDRNRLKGDTASSLVSRIKKYHRGQGSFFYFSDAAVRYNVATSLQDTSVADSLAPPASVDFDRPAVDVTPGFGYGRFINATALRKAVRIEDFLLKEGIIEERLPKKTMVELGHIIEKEDEYRDLYGDRYENYWYEDMQNEIQKSKLVLGSIGAIGVLRMQEVLTKERINDRFYGWDISAGMKLEAITPSGNVDREDPAVAVRLRYSRPVSWSTQVNTDLSINTPATGDFGDRFDLAQQTDFTYEISNRIDYSIIHLLSLTKRQGFPEMHVNTVSTGLRFFIENKIDLTTDLLLRKGKTERWKLSFSTGLTYRIF